MENKYFPWSIENSMVFRIVNAGGKCGNC